MACRSSSAGGTARIERRQQPNVSRTRHVGGFLSTSVASFSVVLNIR